MLIPLFAEVTIKLEESEITQVINIVGSYIFFGLALYGIAALYQIRRAILRSRLARQLKRDLVTITNCLAGYEFIEACRQVWDSAEPSHFPIWPSRIFLILFLPQTGIAAHRLYRSLAKWLSTGAGIPSLYDLSEKIVPVKHKPRPRTTSTYRWAHAFTSLAVLFGYRR